ncbi:MAG: CPXCG motif-containing cysteine-rich protein [Gemmatimonadetes bacterium]|nr:CPXCG motif-containing cysteine-rich protein [Gemmatimonadota bacterium]MCC6770877.1 CPXCG motif-containing cysteine-rich protein [Gemmatimonadaceae bacterium]
MEPLDADDFDTGDGTADTDNCVRCPHCGEENVIFLDPGSGASQQYVEDCQVCCRPWRVVVSYDADGHANVDVTQLDE